MFRFTNNRMFFVSLNDRGIFTTTYGGRLTAQQLQFVSQATEGFVATFQGFDGPCISLISASDYTASLKAAKAGKILHA